MIVFIFLFIFGTIKGNIVVSELFLIRLDRCFWSVHHHNKRHTNNIFFPLYHLYIWKMLVVQNHKIHCSKGFINIKVNRVISELLVIWLEQCFLLKHHHKKIRTHTIFFHCFVYIYFAYLSCIVTRFIIRTIFETIKVKRVVSGIY